MQTEIERKFLTSSSLFKKQAVRTMDLRQGYIGCPADGEARVSIRDQKAWVIIKSQGRLSRLEYELPIPKEDAEILLKEVCGRIIHKTRYIVPSETDMLKWEVDVFHGVDDGLILAEIELPSEDTHFELPSWIGKEVTDDYLYYNSTLATSDYNTLISKRKEAEAWDSWRDSLVK